MLYQFPGGCTADLRICFQCNSVCIGQLFDQLIFYINIYLSIATQPTKVSEYDQEIPQSQTADNPMAPRRRVKQ